MLHAGHSTLCAAFLISNLPTYPSPTAYLTPPVCLYFPLGGTPSSTSSIHNSVLLAMQQCPPLVANVFASPVGVKSNRPPSTNQKKMISQNAYGDGYQLSRPLHFTISIKKVQFNSPFTTSNTKINQTSANDWAGSSELNSIPPPFLKTLTVSFLFPFTLKRSVKEATTKVWHSHLDSLMHFNSPSTEIHWPDNRIPFHKQINIEWNDFKM